MNSTAVQGITLQRTASWLFLLLWVVVSALGFLFIGVMFHYPGAIPVGDFVAFDLPFALLELFTLIFNLGAALFGLVLATLTGLLVGLLQWLVLRNRVSHAVWWIPVSLVGWYLAWLLGTLALNTTGPLNLAWIPVIGEDPHAVFSLVFGVVYSAISGVFWLWLLCGQKASAM